MHGVQAPRSIRYEARGGLTMNCSYCDNSFNPDAHFCPRCGAKLYQAAPPPFYAAPVRPPRVACNLQALGILWAI